MAFTYFILTTLIFAFLITSRLLFIFVLFGFFTFSPVRLFSRLLFSYLYVCPNICSLVLKSMLKFRYVGHLAYRKFLNLGDHGLRSHSVLAR